MSYIPLLPINIELQDSQLILVNKFVHGSKSNMDDMLYMRNLIKGKITSSNVYPLIYDNKDNISEKVLGLTYYKTLQFYDTITPKIYSKLDYEQKASYCIGLRDLYYYRNSNDSQLITKEKFTNAIKCVDEPIYCYNIQNLSVSPTPTHTHIIMHWLKVASININPIDLETFIVNDMSLCMVFLNPVELSYHNFENILDLDGYVERNLKLKITSTNIEKHNTLELWRIKMHKSISELKKIDKLDLYVEPLNSDARGGNRIIFKSQYLSDCLTSMINNLGDDHKILKTNFITVNNIFRFNKFKPGDKKFISHYDTPYNHNEKKHYSMYTILIYLTSCKSVGLVVEDESFIIKKNECIIFNQKYLHEGYAFPKTDKIFLRSELIYYVPNLKQDMKVARIFNISCYNTKQAFFNDEIKQYINSLFNVTNKMRHLNTDGTNIPHYSKQVYLKNKSRQQAYCNFVTNGHDYYFNKDFDLKTAAIIILVDYFNGKNDIMSITSTVINKNVMLNDLSPFIKSKRNTKLLVKAVSFPENIRNDDDFDLDLYVCQLDCINEDTKGYARQIEYAFDEKSKFSLIVLGSKVEINIDDIVIRENDIMFNKTSVCDKLIFASCQCESNDLINDLDYVNSIVRGYNLPNITFMRNDNCVHFIIDAFKCGTVYHDSAMMVIDNDSHIKGN